MSGRGERGQNATGVRERGALAAIDRILNRGGDADDVLRQVLDVVAGLYGYVALGFVEESGIAVGPELGSAPGDVRSFDVVFEETKVGELRAAPAAPDDAFLARVALLISPYCLVGWDTGGEPWEP